MFQISVIFFQYIPVKYLDSSALILTKNYDYYRLSLIVKYDLQRVGMKLVNLHMADESMT